MGDWKIVLDERGEEVFVDKFADEPVEVKEMVWCLTCGQSHFRCEPPCKCQGFMVEVQV